MLWFITFRHRVDAHRRAMLYFAINNRFGSHGTPAWNTQAVPGVTFNKDYMYDGPWRVLWKTNTAWQKYFDPLNSVADNRAYQWYKEVSPERNAGREARAAFSFSCFVVWRGRIRLCDMSDRLAAEPYRSRERGTTREILGYLPEL